MESGRQTSIIDKSTWGEGPWQTEPDRLEWRHAGFPCLLVRHSHSGHWCGYVGVPPGHPLHGKDCFEDFPADIDVHGGLTYSKACYGDVCHVPAEGEPDDVWWLGFDAAHAGDVSCLGSRHRLPEHLRQLSDYETYKDMTYMQQETNRLAEQLGRR